MLEGAGLGAGSTEQRHDSSGQPLDQPGLGELRRLRRRRPGVIGPLYKRLGKAREVQAELATYSGNFMRLPSWKAVAALPGASEIFAVGCALERLA